MVVAPARPAPWSRVFVTRPRDEGQAWVEALRRHGWPALSLPLIDIGPPRDAEALAGLAQARAGWFGQDALMFVSAAAVQHFFDGLSAAVPPVSGSKTRFWAPGPGTARALAAALAPLGVDASRIDSPAADAPQFDSEHLWPVVAPQVHPDFRLLLVRGASADAGARCRVVPPAMVANGCWTGVARRAPR